MPDYKPDLEPYVAMSPFKAWCQKVIPGVYDGSISVYEMLCKLTAYINQIIDNMNGQQTDITNLLNAYNQLQEYVNTYFDSLDVQDEINNKLDEMVKNGEFILLFDNYIPYVTPQMFGAKGDGVTDDTESFIKAFNNKVVVIPTGTYLISKNLTFGGTLVGADQTGTIIAFKGLAEESYAITITENFTSLNNITFIGEYDPECLTNGQFNGIKCESVWNLNFTGVQVRKFKNSMYMNSSWNNMFDRCTFSRSDVAILGDSEINNVLLLGCFVKYNNVGFRKKDGTNVVLDGSDFSYNDIGYVQEGIGITSVFNCYFEDNLTSLKQVYGLKPTDMMVINGCSFYCGTRENEIIINILNGDCRIKECYFKVIGDYTPMLTNRRIIITDCKITGAINLSVARSVQTTPVFHYEDTKTYISLNVDGSATLSITGIREQTSHTLFIIPEPFVPNGDYVAYATFKTVDGDSIDIEFTINSAGEVIIDKLPTKLYARGNLTLKYMTKL